MEELHINKPKRVIEIHNNIPLSQRKIFNCLMLRALLSGELRKGGYYKITVKELMHLTGNKQKDFLQLDKQVSEMQTTLIQWAGSKEGDFGRVQFLGEVEYKDGVLEYFFSQKLIRIVQNNPQFGRLNMGAIRAMESKYSLALYEWACLYKDHKHGTGFRVLTDLKLILCGDAKMYPAYKDFNRYVIKSAIKEVNDKTDINIYTKTQKKGRSINAICFYVETKKEFCALLERPKEEAETKLELKGDKPTVEQVPENELLSEMSNPHKSKENHYINENIGSFDLYNSFPEDIQSICITHNISPKEAMPDDVSQDIENGKYTADSWWIKIRSEYAPKQLKLVEEAIKRQEIEDSFEEQKRKDEEKMEQYLEEYYKKYGHMPGRG